MARHLTADDVVRARINGDVKREATVILSAIGLTPSDAFRMLLARIVADKALPFDPLVPNEETVAAIREARTAQLPRFTTTQELLNDLNADD